jgi:hypothetical protein
VRPTRYGLTLIPAKAFTRAPPTPASSRGSGKDCKGAKMPRGSKPGERRGGRQRGTPNKSTVLKNAAIAAAANDPNLSPLDFLLKLMRQPDLPLELRVTVAHQALPFAHIKKKAVTSTKVTYGDSQTVVNEKLGPRVKVVKVKSDHADADSITPLDFLLGVMRNAKSPESLRLRVAGMVAPYVHPRGEPGQLEETRAALMVDEDPYGFDPEILESLSQDQERSRALLKRHEDGQGLPWDFAEYYAALEKVKQTPAYVELEKRIADKFPSTYKELDSRLDRARLTELEEKGKTRPLTAAEEIEQRHLRARLACYAETPQGADCRRMNSLRALSADLRFPEEEEELKGLEARYPEVPFDPTHERLIIPGDDNLRRASLAWRKMASKASTDKRERWPRSGS